MSCELFEKINPVAKSEVTNSYLGDDYMISLDSVVGAAIQAFPTASLSINLIDNAVLALASFVPIVNGIDGNNFATGDVCGVIQNSLLDVLPRQRYYVVLRVVEGTLQKTYRLPIAVNLVNLI
jgi:hypothetical protein